MRKQVCSPMMPMVPQSSLEVMEMFSDWTLQTAPGSLSAVHTEFPLEFWLVASLLGDWSVDPPFA